MIRINLTWPDQVALQVVLGFITWAIWDLHQIIFLFTLVAILSTGCFIRIIGHRCIFTPAFSPRLTQICVIVNRIFYVAILVWLLWLFNFHFGLRVDSVLPCNGYLLSNFFLLLTHNHLNKIHFFVLTRRFSGGTWTPCLTHLTLSRGLLKLERCWIDSV
jgi:hypothetical protein